MKNITAFCQLLLWPIISAVLADTDIPAKPKYRPISSHKWGRFRPFWLRFLGPEQVFQGSILIKSLEETKLKSESFELFIGSLRFLIQKLE